MKYMLLFRVSILENDIYVYSVSEKSSSRRTYGCEFQISDVK